MSLINQRTLKAKRVRENNERKGKSYHLVRTN